MIGFNELGRKGNLGNQMFQYAGLRGIAANRGFEWSIPQPGPSWIHGQQMFEAFDMGSLTSAHFGAVKEKTYFSPGKRDRGNSTGFEFDEHLFSAVPDDVNLNAFFQSPRYFLNIEKEIRADFRIKDDLRDQVTLAFPETLETYISLHVRRGDYLKFPKHHPVQSIDYYASALEVLPRIPVLITTDDPGWVSGQRLFQQERFKLIRDSSSLIDFTIQSLATYSIISNSSFGWWGAWLASPVTVVAPTIWFGPKLAHQSIVDLYPQDWVLI